MAWRNRLRELILAGGTLAIGGCSGGGIGPLMSGVCGNANPDPCICGRPDASQVSAMQCDQKMACEADGGMWNPYVNSVDGALTQPHCDPTVPDGGVD